MRRSATENVCGLAAENRDINEERQTSRHANDGTATVTVEQAPPLDIYRQPLWKTVNEEDRVGVETSAMLKGSVTIC